MQNKLHGLTTLLFAGLMTAASVFAQQTNPAPKPVAPAPALQARAVAEPEETVKPDTASQQGIKVHGHWVIDIKNPDGTLAQHHEFENSLNASGGALLVGLLSGQMSAGDWMISLGPSGTGPCVGGSYQFCAIVQSTTGPPASAYCTLYQCNTGLTVTPNYGTALAGPYSFVLSGSITAVQAGSIGSVYTQMEFCEASGSSVVVGGTTQNPTVSSNVAPSACGTTTTGNASSAPLTSTTITPIAVANGQLIQVTVTISFS